MENRELRTQRMKHQNLLRKVLGYQDYRLLLMDSRGLYNKVLDCLKTVEDNAFKNGSQVGAVFALEQKEIQESDQRRAELGVHWYILGTFLGYPQCCITEFVERSGKAPDNQITASNGTGFIPCKECTAAIENKAVTLDELIQNRVHSDSFPSRVVNHDQFHSYKNHFKKVYKLT